MLDGIQLHSSECGYPVFLTPFIEKSVLSPLSGLEPLVQNNITIYVMVYFWVLYILFHWSICLFYTVSHFIAVAL